MPKRARSLAVLCGAVLCLGISGCSHSAGTSSSVTDIADKPAAEILREARANAFVQDSVHVKGNGECPQSPFYIDMRLTHDGSATGVVRFGDSSLVAVQHPTLVEIIATRTRLLLKADTAFWTSQTSAKAAHAIGSRWVSTTRAGNTCLAALTSFTALLDNYVGYPGKPSKQPSSSIFGTPAVLLSLPNNVAIWVATQGTPLPVRIDDPTTHTGISLGDWGSPVAVGTPPAGEVIDATRVKS